MNSIYYEPAWIEQGIWALLGVALVAFYLIVIGLLVLRIVGYWKLFEKAGQPGWKALIPLYADYTLYGIGWKKSIFWLIFGIGIGAALLSGFTGAVSAVLMELSMGYGAGIVVWVLGIMLSLAGGVAVMALEIVFAVKLSRAFGHGGGFAVGLVLLPSVFYLILGLGKSQYQK